MTDKELRILDEMLTNLEIWSTWNKTFANEMIGICSKMRNLLADRKTENSSEKPNNCDTCRFELYCPEMCEGCCEWDSHYEPKDEPQRNMAEDIVESFGFKAESYRQAKVKTEPQTYITEDRDTQMLDAWQVKLKAEQTEPTTQTETQNSNKNSNVISVYDGETSTKFEKVQLTDEPQTDEPTWEQVKEYCNKRCLDIVDSALRKKWYKDEPQTDCSWK